VSIACSGFVFRFADFFIFKSKHDKFGHCRLLWLRTGCAEILLSGYKFEVLAKGLFVVTG
jgi:hypothetical protein